jgi:AcrR family transcriptional regulator
LEVAQRHLSARGYEAMSLVAVAEEVGTIRQAIYRRWPTKASLAAAAVAATKEPPPNKPPSDPLADLTAELADFRYGISLAGRMSLVGTMLQDSTAADLRARYQAEIIRPHRERLRGILERARSEGLIAATADLKLAVTLCTGSRYARALAGADPPANWPVRTAHLVWRAVGGVIPTANPPAQPRHSTRRTQVEDAEMPDPDKQAPTTVTKPRLSAGPRPSVYIGFE